MFYATGEFNCNVLDYNKIEKVTKFLNLTFACDLVPIINKPIETVFRRCSVKKIFLKIQSLFFNKVAGLYRTPLVAAFEPSQVTKNTATAIDHVLRLLHRAITTGIIKLDIYDHFPIFLVAEIEKRITLE